MQKQVALITGAAGFLGRHVCAALGRRGWTIRAVDNFSAGSREPLPGAEIIEADVSTAAGAELACRGASAVVHLAAFSSVPRSLADPDQARRDTEQSTLELIRAASARGISRFVFASSSSVYGDAGKPPVQEDSPLAPKSPYAQAKLASEVHLRQAAPGLDAVCLRFFNIYGPGQRPDATYAAAIPQFCRRILRDEEVTIYGDGEQTRDFLYVEDAALSVAAALEAKRRFDGAPVNVASGECVTINRLVALIGELAGRRPRVRHEGERRGDVRLSQADVSRAKSWMDFQAATPLQVGLSRTLAWLSSH